MMNRSLLSHHHDNAPEHISAIDAAAHTVNAEAITQTQTR
jgi:hypothetical protein